jgi:hypothetical protein
METAQESDNRGDLSDVDAAVRPRLGPEALQASLEAVRSAQASARARARRETRWARLIATGALMAIGVTAWAAAHRPPKARAVAARPAVAVAVATPSAATPAVTTAPTEAPPIAAPPREAPAVEQPASSEAVTACDAAFEERNWTAIASTCAAAFEARPHESALAMRMAQAEHRHGHIAAAGGWARKALALDADIPEAYVIVAHADVAAGEARAAADAYRHYLALAPRGWHAPEARRALRAAER